MSKAKTAVVRASKTPSPIIVRKDGYSFGGELAKRIQECAKERGESTDTIVTKALAEFVQRQGAEQLAEDAEIAAYFRGDDGSLEELLFDASAMLWFLSVNGNVRPVSLANALWWYTTRSRLHDHGGDFGWHDELTELFREIHRELAAFEEFRPQLEAKREERRRGYFARQAA